MRWSLLLLLVAIPRLALAEPKVALAALEGDDGKIAEMVGDALSERAKLTKPARVEVAMRSMGVSVLSTKTVKKLRAKLDVDVVIYGKVERDGSTKTLSLTFAGNAKAKPRLEIEATTPKQLRKELAGTKLAKRIESAMEGEAGDDEEDEEDAKEAERKAREEERKQKEAEEERKREDDKRRKKEEEEERKREEEASRKKRDDDDGDRRKRRGDDDDEDEGRKKRDKRGDDEDEDGGGKKRDKRVADEDDEDGSRARKRLGDEDEEDADEDRPRRKRKKQRRHVLTQTALWLDAGAAFARRTLTYEATGMVRPPPVGTIAPAAQIEAEVYPGAFESLKSTVAGFGLTAAYSRTFALGIAVPGTQTTASIKSGHYSVGARYRFVFGQHSLAAGVGYWRRYYMADRSKLMNADQLDMPDVDYSAVAPGASVRIAATPTIAAFGSVDVPLVLNSGPIQEPKSYGSAKIIAFDFRGGAQIMVADHAALEISAEFVQIGLFFQKQAGSKASTREVSKATDRSMGLSASIGITY